MWSKVFIKASKYGKSRYYSIETEEKQKKCHFISPTTPSRYTPVTVTVRISLCRFSPNA